MLISLVVCTRNRIASLRACLDYVGQLEAPGAWELVVVDNGSTDGTADALADFARKASFPMVVVREPIPGLGRARNAGIAAAAGDVIAFTDDDCYVASDYLVQMVALFRQRQIGFMGGRVLLYDETDIPETIRTETKEYFIAPNSVIRAGQLLGANMAFRRSLLREIGGFDSDFGAGSPFRSCEETDLQTRASFAGATGIYHSAPLVRHHHGRKPGADHQKIVRGYDFGRGAYYAKLLLDPKTRMPFLKNWYWWAFSNFRDRTFKTVFRDLSGALFRGGLCYCRLRLQRRAGRVSPERDWHPKRP